MYAGSLKYNTKLDTAGFQKGVNKLTGTAKSGGATIKSIVAGLGITKIIEKGIGAITNSVDDAIKRFDTLNNFPKVMESLGIESKNAEKAINKLSDKLTGLPTTLDSATSSVARFVSKNGDIDKSTDIFLALNNAIIAGNSSMQVQSAALEQVTQAYSRGKFEMEEWKSLLVAAPGQVKQVATAFGMTTDALYDAMKSGDISMDAFMSKIIELNTKGVKGFASFEEQARNAVGGIETSITNMRTAITRGMTKIIEAIDKGLASVGLGSLAEVIAQIGTKMETSLKKVASVIPSVIQTIYKLRTAIIGVVGAITLYKTAMAGINALRIWSSLSLEMSKATKSQILFNTELSVTQKLMLLLNNSNAGGFFNSISVGSLNAVKNIGRFIVANKLLSVGIFGVVGVLATLGTMLVKNNGDFGKTAEQIKGIVTKIIDVVKKIIIKLPEIINKIIPEIINFIENSYPKIIQSVSKIIVKIANNISKTLPKVIATVTNIIPQILPPLLDGLVQLVTTLVNMLPTILPVMINGLLTLIMALVGMIGTILPPLINALIQAAVMIIEALVQALPTIIIALVNAIPQIIISLSKTLIKCVPTLIQAAIQIIGLIVKSIPQIIVALIKAIPNIVKSMATTLKNNWKAIFNAGLELIKKLWAGFKSWVNNLLSNVLNFAKSIPKKIAEGFANIKNIGENLVRGLWNGIKNVKNWVFDKIKNFGSSILSKLKSSLKEHSPSKATREMGVNLVKGLGLGISDKQKALYNQVDKLGKTTLKKMYKGLNSKGSLNDVEKVSFWSTIVKNTKKGTTAYTQALSKLNSARKTLKSDVTKTTKTLASELKSIDNEIKERKNSIINSLNLFDKFQANKGTSKQALKENLNSQITALKDWNNVMTSLKKKIKNKNLYEFLEDQDISSLKTLQEINSMSTKELRDYENLYAQKEKLADTKARAEYSSKIESAKQTYINSLKKLGIDGSKASRKVGSQIAAGINAGFTSGMKGTTASLKRQLKKMLDSAKKQLKIHSPSRVYRDDIGKQISAGIGIGVEINTKSAIEAIRKLNDEMYNEMKKSVVVSTGAVKSDATINSNYGFNNKFTLNAEFKGNVDLDGKKVGQILTPTVAKTLKTGGVL